MSSHVPVISAMFVSIVELLRCSLITLGRVQATELDPAR